MYISTGAYATPYVYVYACMYTCVCVRVFHTHIGIPLLYVCMPVCMYVYVHIDARKGALTPERFCFKKKKSKHRCAYTNFFLFFFKKKPNASTTPIFYFIFQKQNESTGALTPKLFGENGQLGRRNTH